MRKGTDRDRDVCHCDFSKPCTANTASAQTCVRGSQRGFWRHRNSLLGQTSRSLLWWEFSGLQGLPGKARIIYETNYQLITQSLLGPAAPASTSIHPSIHGCCKSIMAARRTPDAAARPSGREKKVFDGGVGGKRLSGQSRRTLPIASQKTDPGAAVRNNTTPPPPGMDGGLLVSGKAEFRIQIRNRPGSVQGRNTQICLVLFLSSAPDI